MEDMDKFENSTFERPQSEEVLKAKASELVSQIERLKKLSVDSGENIDAELGSEDYKDFGHMAEARELEAELESINAQLADHDDEKAAQRNLPL